MNEKMSVPNTKLVIINLNIMKKMWWTSHANSSFLYFCTRVRILLFEYHQNILRKAKTARINDEWKNEWTKNV